MNTIKCNVCKREIPEDSVYCPYCGRRSRRYKPTFNNMEWLGVCGEEEFKKQFETMKSMDANDARDWLFHMHEPVTAYVIKIKFEQYRIDSHGRRIPGHDSIEERTNPGSFLATVVSGSDGYYLRYKLLSAVPVEKQLYKSDFKELGTEVFLTIEECAEKISEFWNPDNEECV